MASAEPLVSAAPTRNESGGPEAPRESATYGTTEKLLQIVGNPLADAQEAGAQWLSIGDFWKDMIRRERTGFHQGSVVLGYTLCLVASIYCVVLKVDHLSSVEDEVLLNFLAVELAVSGVCQLFYSVWGICLENSPMLLIANINAIGIATRLGLSLTSSFLVEEASISFFVIFTVFTVAHLGVTGWAWGGEFCRFMCFVIGTDEAVQKMYRKYQLMCALSMMDVQFTLMSTITLLFFVSTAWWHYVVLAAVFLISCVMRTGLRQAIRRERVPGLALLIPLYLAVPAFLGVSLWKREILDATVPDTCYKVAVFIAAWFFVIRVALLASAATCIANFGQGMKEAFKREKTVRQFFAERKARKFKFQLPTAA